MYDTNDLEAMKENVFLCEKGLK